MVAPPVESHMNGRLGIQTWSLLQRKLARSSVQLVTVLVEDFASVGLLQLIPCEWPSQKHLSLYIYTSASQGCSVNSVTRFSSLLECIHIAIADTDDPSKNIRSLPKASQSFANWEASVCEISCGNCLHSSASSLKSWVDWAEWSPIVVLHCATQWIWLHQSRSSPDSWLPLDPFPCSSDVTFLFRTWTMSSLLELSKMSTMLAICCYSLSWLPL